MISEYWDAVAVGSQEYLFIFFTCQKKRPIKIPLPASNQTLIDADNTCVQWGLSEHALFQPVVMVSRGSVMYIINVVLLGASGFSRGHGGAITSISVHPTTPNLFCTTSRDNTTRVYDLVLEVLQPTETPNGKRIRTSKTKIYNAHWPPSTKPSFAGAAHGLRLVRHEAEGSGIGRCIVVLMGGRSGGHHAAVLGAAFHPIFPILATCGMDRCVKIWPIRPVNPFDIKTEDKPLFSSSRIHKASVLSVNWYNCLLLMYTGINAWMVRLADDILLTHSAPAHMRRYPNDSNDRETYLEPGELILWRWLGVDRFFPPKWEDLKASDLLFRGCSSDYQESSSFKLVAIHAFPSVETQYITPKLSVFKSPTHDPIILFTYPNSTSFDMINVCHLSPKRVPPFPLDLETPETPERQTTPTPSSTRAAAPEGVHTDVEDEREVLDELDGTPPVQVINKTPVINGREEVPPPGLEGWTIDIRDHDNGFKVWDDNKKLMNVAMGVDGQFIVGVGSGGSLWVWRPMP
ncbi:hypothetical protein CPB83DRAFT_753678 [Crepidotus variabilis]|uniref:Uncharacterized protein n=1 Tax=Crepidotus variabilis TaxID=179855 RepID=A0A9P6JWS9_9AGAR|nr:hypothetical protein CPB83DRAFT_753678 [Crepidotus variabilis]